MSTNQVHLFPGVGDQVRQASGTTFTDAELATVSVLVLGLASSILNDGSIDRVAPRGYPITDDMRRAWQVNSFTHTLLPGLLSAGVFDVAKANEFVNGVVDFGPDPTDEQLEAAFPSAK